MFAAIVSLALIFMPPPEWRTDLCWSRFWEAIRQIDVRVRGGQYDEAQRLAATRRALLAYLECKGFPAQATSPNPNAD
jgi:hypothetical protein